jgi:hypothetical protein
MVAILILLVLAFFRLGAAQAKLEVVGQAVPH